MRRLLAILIAGVALPALAQEYKVTVMPDTWDLYRGVSIVENGRDFPTEQACHAAAATHGIGIYTCRTQTRVIVTLASTPTPPVEPEPPVEPVPPEEPPVPPTTPTGATFTDLATAPACAKVTIYPERKVVTPAEAGIPTHEGRCLEATPATFTREFWAAVQPGDVVYLRAGTYSTRAGEGTWYTTPILETYKKGTADRPIALVAYPGELVTLRPSDGRPAIVLGDGSRAQNFAAYLTFAGLNIVAQRACISGGGDTTKPEGGPDETGGHHIRVVGIRCEITDATGNTMTGMVALQADGWKVLGNTFRDPPNRSIINNNHGVYIQGGADDVEVAYNDFQLRLGHVIQNHQDGAKKLHERVSIHDNVIRGVNHGDSRGIAVINVHNDSTIEIARNRVSHQGQGGWGCINLYNGQVTVLDNECTDSQGGLNLNGQYSGAARVTASGNLICPLAGYPRTKAENGASLSQLTETNPRPCN